LLFPDGKLPSPRWRPVVLLAGTGIALSTLPFMFGPELDMEVPEGTPQPPNPLAVELGAVWEITEAASFILLSCALLLALASVIVRYRRSQGDERQQIKWLMCAVGLVLLSAVTEPLVPDAAEYLFVVALVSLAGAIAIAVLKYRLYEIDLIINRTLVYVPLTALLAGLFVASTTLVRTVFTDLTDTGSDATIAISTLLVVAALTPVKNHLQAFVDKHFKDQHDGLRGLRTLTIQAQNVIRVLEAARFAQAFLDEAVSALDAQGGSIELVVGGERRVVIAGEAPATTELTLPLRHAGEEVGWLSIGPSRKGTAYDEETRKSLQASADVLAEVVHVASKQGATASALPLQNGATVAEAIEPAPAASSALGT
jgi:hypothetical protein